MSRQTLLTSREVAEHLRVTPATVLTWYRRGRIPAFAATRKPILFDLDAVLAAMRQGQEGASKRGVPAHA